MTSDGGQSGGGKFRGYMSNHLLDEGGILDTLGATLEVSFAEVRDDIAKLRVIRNFDDVDRQTAIQALADKGISYESSFFSLPEYQNALRFYANHLSVKGNSQFLDFLAVLKNTTFIPYALWSKDYEKFVQEDAIEESDKVEHGGEYYLTSHVDITYDLANLPFEEDDFYGIFEFIAPIHMVLHRFVGAVFVETDLYYAMSPGLVRRTVAGEFVFPPPFGSHDLFLYKVAGDLVIDEASLVDEAIFFGYGAILGTTRRTHFGQTSSPA